MSVQLANGYSFVSTFGDDFAIANHFGKDAIRDTFNRAFEEWKTNHVYLTELVIITNLYLWKFWREGNDEYARLYDELWRKADEYAVNNLKGEELEFFYWVTD